MHCCSAAALCSSVHRAASGMLIQLAALAFLAPVTPGAVAQKPNILLVVVDDHGWSDLGFTGRSRINTPTIDRLVHEGVHLTQAYVQKVCSPTRAAIMTGRYPHRNGMQDPFCGGSPQGLNLNETLLPQYLAEVGYQAHAVGKWHLGFTSWEHTPTFRGFQSFYGYYGCAEDYFTHNVPLHQAGTGLDFHDDVRPKCGRGCSRPAREAVANFSCYDHTEVSSAERWGNTRCFLCDDWEHYSTHLIAARASTIIANHDTSRPLFLYLPFQDTHNPAEAPKLYADKVDNSSETGITHPLRRILAAKLAVLDEAMANITGALRGKGMLDSSVIVYTTDNGGPIVPTTGAPDDAVGSSNWPLRGGKHTPYEGGVRATAFVWDGRGVVHPKGSRGLTWSGLMHAVDWLPTICALAGCAPLPSKPVGKYGLSLDGVDVSAALIANTTSPRSAVVLDLEKPTGQWKAYGQGVVRIGAWKLFAGFPDGEKRPGDWSNPRPWENVTASEPFLHHGPLQLFDVLTDPNEREDRINDTDVPEGILEALIDMLNAEQSVAVYPFSLGPRGSANEEGVWEPWMNETDRTQIV